MWLVTIAKNQKKHRKDILFTKTYVDLLRNFKQNRV